MFDNYNDALDIVNDGVAYQFLLDFLKSSPSYHYISNTQYKLVAVCPQETSLINLDNDRAIGLRCSELPYKGAEIANQFEIAEQQVILSGKSQICLCYQYYEPRQEMFFLLCHKNPIFGKDNQVIGVWNSAVELPEHLGRSFIQYFAQPHTQRDNHKQFVLYVSDEYQCSLKLTPRQNEVMFFLLRGKTARDIAELLNLSPRTVESYIDTIKLSMNCLTRAELIEKGIAAGYLGILPENLFRRFSAKAA